MVTSAVQSWLPGSTIGQYLLVRELARGGMGEIWLARQTSFDRLVVLKRVLAGPGADPEAMTMFLDEARIASQLHHPNIVQVFELGNDAGSAYLVMEYLTGQTLNALTRKLIEAQGRVPEHLAVEIISAAARGLGSAHRRTDLQGRHLEIVHRDVSPQNLFLTYEGEVKVLDFGIARAAGRLVRTMMGVIKGKVAYMSPEQAAGGELPVSGAADVYALGIILFELVTGTRFYKVKDDLAILQRLAVMSAPPTPSSRAQVDPALEAIILKALAPESADRYADGQLFHEALEGWRRAHPIPHDAVDLRSAMRTNFAKELEALNETHKQAALTPMRGSSAVAKKPLATEVARAPEPPKRKPLAEAATAETPQFKPSAEGATAETPQFKPVAARPTVVSPAAVKTVLMPQAPPPRRALPGLAFGALALLLVTAAAGVWWLKRAPAAVVVVAPEVFDAGVVAPPPFDAGVVMVEAIEAPDANVPDEPPAPPKDERTVPVVRAPDGRLSLDTEPWSTVYLGKKKLGDTPLIDFALPSGRHRLHLVNAKEKVDSVIEVVIKPHETTTKRLAF